MTLIDNYNRIRPYIDKEVPSAINRIVNHQLFKKIVGYLYGNNIDKKLEEYCRIKSVGQFQEVFSHKAVRKVIEKTASSLTVSGLENIENNKAYLFISNHRDIVLDSAILQIVLVENNHKTSQITFGSNLMTSDFIVDLGKLNKMFTLQRGGSRIQKYKSALLHSEYIKMVICDEKESIWIAQKDGRLKDGKDATQDAPIKMLTMGKNNPHQSLKELNIIPLAISYEYEPCDSQKIQEKYISRSSEYVKKEGEDLASVLSGITNYKGHIHLAFGKALDPVINSSEQSSDDLNKLTEKVAKEIDQQIYSNFYLNPNNYIAYDLLKGKEEFLNRKYSEQELRKFVEYIEKKTNKLIGEKSLLKKMFIELYAMPVTDNVRYNYTEQDK